MGLTGKRVTNIYGADIVDIGASNLKVYIYEGEKIFNLTTGLFVVAPDVTVGADHLVTATAIPDGTNVIGFQLTIPDDLPLGTFDLVFLNLLVYGGGVRFHVGADGTITIIPE